MTNTQLPWISILLLGFCSVASAGERLAPGQGFAAVPGGPVWYKVTGSGDGIPLLTLHGGPGDTSCGFARLDPLGDQRPVVRYDQLGTGRSGRPDDTSLWTVEHYVEELDVLRRTLGLERMHLLGHSWGASLAAAYVQAKGTDGIESVIFSSPLLSTPLWVRDADLQRSELPEDVQRTLEAHEKAGTTDSPEYQAASEVYYERHMYAGKKPAATADCKGAPESQVIYEYMWGPQEFFATGTLIEFDVTPRLHEINVPVLFLTGEFDEARPETVAGFQKLVPGSQFHVIMGAGHATLTKKPEEYRAIVEEFLDQVESREQEERQSRLRPIPRSSPPASGESKMLNAMAAAMVCLAGTDPAAAAIRDARDSFNRAIAQEDHVAIAGILAEDVILVTGTDSTLISGRAAQVEEWRQDFKDDGRLVYVRTPDCVSGSPILPIALETGTWRGAPLAGGDDHVGGVYLAKWRLVENRWIIEAEIFASLDCGGGLCPKSESGTP